MHKLNWDELYLAGRDYKTMNTRLLSKVLRETKIQAGSKVLDFGCGTGDLARKLAAAGMEVVAVDTSAEAISLAEQRSVGAKIEFKIIDKQGVGSLATNPKFDAIFLKLVIAFIPDQTALLSALKKLIKAQGSIIIITPVRFDDNATSRFKNISVEYQEFIDKINHTFETVKEINRDYSDENGEEIVFKLG